MPVKYQTFYHLYNHAISTEALFKDDENFNFFLDKYFYYLRPIVKTYAYCLMPNHFHFLIQMRSEKEVKEFFARMINLAGFQNLQGLRDNINLY